MSDYKGVCWCGHVKKSHDKKGSCQAKKSKFHEGVGCLCGCYGRWNRFWDKKTKKEYDKLKEKLSSHSSDKEKQDAS